VRRLALAMAALALAACTSPRRSEPLSGPFVPASPDVARGEHVFMAHCHLCHPGGEAGLGPSLNDKPLPGFAIRTQVRAGLGAMPAFAPEEVSAADLDAVIAYLRARRAR
jgi:mono/diheme cytochrome c family protein